jgi:hypothetical protein
VVAAVLGVSLLGLAWAFGGPGGLLYVLVYGIATAPGWPLGFALFGRRHAAGWILGAVLGYAITAVALWMPIAARQPSPGAFLLVWLAITGAIWLVARRETPLIPLPRWSRADTTALLLILLLVPAIIGVPYLKTGTSDNSGTRYYRAYFTADYLWHVALTSEMAKFDMPPVNPYLANNRIHYYWSYFLLPATVSGLAPAGFAGGTEGIVKTNALCSALLFLATIFMVTWSAVPKPLAAALAVLFAVVAASAEGLYGIYYVFQRGRGWEGLRDLNIDAMSYWVFRGLSIDGLPRSLLWIPQHAMACALGLVGVTIAGRTGASAAPATIAIAGVAFAMALAFSPLLGAGFAAVYGLVVAFDALVKRRNPLALAPHLLIAVPVALAILWCRSNEMFEGADAALHIGYAGQVRHAPVVAPLLALGPLLVASLPAIVVAWPLATGVSAGVAGLVVGFGIFYFIMLRVDALWAGFRAGQVLLTTMPMLAAAFFERVPRFRAGARLVTIGLLVAAFLIGLPTTLIDVYNAQDITNRKVSPGGFKWTISVTSDQQAVLSWIRESTPANAIVQMDPTARGRETWTLIPSFAERRMAAGLPISLLNIPEYTRSSRRVRTMYGSTDAKQAWEIARSLAINYIYLDDVERAAYPGGVPKFDTSPDLFAPVFRRGDAAVYRVQ